jgi:uncharacterized membrane protein YjgN (DUF898 family)
MAMGWYGLSIVTLGLLHGVARVRLQAYRTRHSLFGNRRASFDGRARDLFKYWFFAWLLAVPTLFLSLVYYAAHEFRYFVAHTRLGDVRFASTLAPRRLAVILSMYYLVWSLLLMCGLLTMAALVIPEIRELLSTGIDDPLVFSMAMTAIFADEVISFVVIGIFVGLAMGVASLTLYIHPLFNAVASSLDVIGHDLDIESIRQAEWVGLAGGEGFADNFDIGTI